MITTAVLLVGLAGGPALPSPTETVPTVSAGLRVRRRVVAGAESLEIKVRLKNEGLGLWYLVWYDIRTAHIDTSKRALSYVEDLNRDPELLSCGGANMFVAPRYKKLKAGSTVILRTQLQISATPPSVAEIVRQVGNSPTPPTLSAGKWMLSARFALLPESIPPSDLIGVSLCEYLSVNEVHIDASLELEVESTK